MNDSEETASSNPPTSVEHDITLHTSLCRALFIFVYDILSDCFGVFVSCFPSFGCFSNVKGSGVLLDIHSLLSHRYDIDEMTII